jgi:hypothetical protein
MVYFQSEQNSLLLHIMSKISILYMILRQWTVRPKQLCSTRLYLLNKIIPCHLKKQCTHL